MRPVAAALVAAALLALLACARAVVPRCSLDAAYNTLTQSKQHRSRHARFLAMAGALKMMVRFRPPAARVASTHWGYGLTGLAASGGDPPCHEPPLSGMCHVDLPGRAHEVRTPLLSSAPHHAPCSHVRTPSTARPRSRGSRRRRAARRCWCPPMRP